MTSMKSSFSYLALYFNGDGTLRTTRMVGLTQVLDDSGAVVMQQETELQAIPPSSPKVSEALGASLTGALNRVQEITDQSAELQGQLAAAASLNRDLTDQVAQLQSALEKLQALQGAE